jgi:hypothetical protein
MLQLPNTLNSLQQQLQEAAEKFSTDALHLSNLLGTFVKDVERAVREPLEIFPVCHHSPSSALQMVNRLQNNPPQVIYMEMCEDLFGVVENLRDCKLPVALQAFASESQTFPAVDMPLSIVAPLTESSAEYQAIAFSLQHQNTKLVFVDRGVDYVFQWEKKNQNQNQEEEKEAASDDAKMHGQALGVEVGNLTPTFDEFLTFLLKNSNTRHFSEWWEQYVEQTLIGADYETYRQVMFLIGSLMRHLGTKKENIESDRLRESYMWTRMKQHMQANNIKPEDAIYICGAAHIASDVIEFGVESNALWDIPELTKTTWLYGLIPSSFVAIEYQFNFPAGTISLAETNWKKALKVSKIKPFNLDKLDKSDKSNKLEKPDKPEKPDKLEKTKTTKTPSSSPKPTSDSPLSNFLTRTPEFTNADTEQLLQWCAEIVGLARKNGYLASTADSIAIYQTSILLANMRNRQHPTPYDFQDAAITCLEKDRTPKKRNIYQLSQILLGGDRIGSIGYASLPPLAQNVYNRLSPLKINLESKANQRALIDFKSQPELLPCSDVLWRLNYLIGDILVQPIMGDRSLGNKPIQESWEIRIGKQQRQLIMLGYEGVTIEQVLEQRLRKKTFDTQAKASHALTAAEDSILYLNSPRFTEELGSHAIKLLLQETGADDAPEIFEKIRNLVHYYRTTASGLPTWIEHFVATGYSHYATMLPQAFADRGTSPEQIAGMLGFIFTLESLALSLGCNRSQLLIGVKQASQQTQDPGKLGLLWTTEWLLNLRSIQEIRNFFNEVLNNPIRIRTFPDYINGFVLALDFAPRISKFVVELLSKLFGKVSDGILLPWLPNLILKLRPHADIMKVLVKEASANFPKNLAGFANGEPSWEIVDKVVVTNTVVSCNEEENKIRKLLFSHRDTLNIGAIYLGVENLIWSDVESKPVISSNEEEVRKLLRNDTVEVFASLLITTKVVNPNKTNFFILNSP